MKPFFVDVQVRDCRNGANKIYHYAVLTQDFETAMSIMRNKLAFGDRATLSEERFTDDELSNLNLKIGIPLLLFQARNIMTIKF